MRCADVSAVRLLARIFVRRLLDNELISPHADRHESLAVAYALVASLAVFVTFFISTPYLAAFVQLPGPTALSALSDRFLFISASMAVCALAALLMWEGLALEPRDTAILGPLPIPPSNITRAKLGAALIFGAVFSIAVNAVPAVLYPAFLTVNLRGISGAGILRLIAAQAMTVVMAGLFGFFAILALRGVLRLALGERGFGRISAVAQSVCVAALVTALLLTPTVGATAVTNWVAGVVAPRWPTLPALWHLGVSETVAGRVVVDTPVVMPPRLTLTPSLRHQDERARSAYRALGASFQSLADSAWLAVPSVVLVAVVLFLWNNRRLPEHSAGSPAFRRTRAAVRAVVKRLTRGNPETRAGFSFTLQTLSRNGPHRLIAAVSIAAASTFSFVALARGGELGQVANRSTPLEFFGIEILALLSLVGGFRYAVAVPAALPANWTVQMAWLGDERAYLTGVKRGGLLLAVIGPLFVLLPLHVALFGLAAALLHSLFGFLFGAAALDTLFLGYRRFPFACSYLPIGDPKLLWPGGAAILLLIPSAFAYAERWSLESPVRSAAFGATLGGIVLVTTIVDRVQRRDRRTVNFNEAPAPPTQRLRLFERVAVHE